MKPGEVTVFSIGDSRNLGSWSNVPYFFTKSLEEKGIRVNRVNIEENRWLSRIYKYTVYALLKAVYKDSSHTYFRSGLNYYLTNLKIKRALRNYPSSQAAIFLTFSFSAPGNTATLLFGDWTYLYSIRNFQKREPCWFERAALRREQQHIASANQVLALFPLSAAFIQQHFHKGCHYLGNVINANYTLQQEKLLKQKTNSQKILFVGTRKYLAGAHELAEVFKKVVVSYPQAELHFIGLEAQETGIKARGIHYHGYLNKSIAVQNETYYRLISEAAVIVNTTPGWGAFSAMTEAMYFYTPVITTPYNEFTETYGKAIGFGYYVSASKELSSAIDTIFSNGPAEQTHLMQAAHKAAKNFTWSNYIDKVLGLLS